MISELELILKACVNMYISVMKILSYKAIIFLSFEERLETKIPGRNQRKDQLEAEDKLEVSVGRAFNFLNFVLGRDLAVVGSSLV